MKGQIKTARGGEIFGGREGAARGQFHVTHEKHLREKMLEDLRDLAAT